MAVLSALAGLSILLIGDSHLSTPTSLIGPLHDDLTKQGAKVHSIGVCGVQAEAWTKKAYGTCGGAERIGNGPPVVMGTGEVHTRPVTDIIQAEHPDVVVVVMGDTMAAYDKPDFAINYTHQQVVSLTSAISQTGTPCVWVGPTWGQEGGKFNKTYERAELMSQFLAVNTSPCTFIDSQKMSKRGQWPTQDGMHFTAAGYVSWAQAIDEALVHVTFQHGKHP